jgi:MoxR-like ATPase
MSQDTSQERAELAGLLEEMSQHIIGQKHLLERLLIALLADGHVLLEGVPGLAKTRTLTVLTSAITALSSRIQFTPDLLPSDLVGTEVYRPQTGSFETRKGPLFTNIVLADEINRAPAKVQSALLQAMQEREVTIGDETFKLPSPFMVLATQNPIEQEGTYPLPEAQLDRFLMKVKIDYPSFDEEVGILKLVTEEKRSTTQVKKVLSIHQLPALRAQMLTVYVDDKIDRYIVTLVRASRQPEQHGLKGMIDWGGSPRASLALKECSRALAFLRGRDHVVPDDIKSVAYDVLRHRILPSFEAEAQGVTSDEIIRVLLASVPLP